MSSQLPAHHPICKLRSNIRVLYKAVYDVSQVNTKENLVPELKAFEDLKTRLVGKFAEPGPHFTNLKAECVAYFVQHGLPPKEVEPTIDDTAAAACALYCHPPCAVPDIYANKDDALKTYEGQSAQLIAADRLPEKLTLLMSRIGEIHPDYSATTIDLMDRRRDVVESRPDVLRRDQINAIIAKDGQFPGERKRCGQKHFRPDHWLAVDACLEWKSSTYPRDETLASVESWERLIRDHAGMSYLKLEIQDSPKTLPEYLELFSQIPDEPQDVARKRLLDDLEHDLAVLRKYHSGIFVATSPPSNEPPAGVADAKAHSITKPARTRKRQLREPKEIAFAAYRLVRLTVMNQSDAAKKLTKEIGPATQGQVSRWVSEVAEWIEAGNVMPDIGKIMNTKPNPIDPKRIELGENPERRAKNQRHRSASK